MKDYMASPISGITILVLLFLAYKLGRHIQYTKTNQTIKNYEAQRELELNEDKEKFKNNYRRFIAKKYRANIPYEKTGFEKRWNDGVDFEKYVLNLFDKDWWNLIDYTKDTIKGVDRKIETSSNPDFVVGHKKSKKKFAIECKYRKNFWINYKEQEEGITLREHHLESYKKFANITKLPVFIVIGLNGWPDKPKKMFLFPLNKAKTFLTKKQLQTFSRDPKEKFIIRRDILT